MIGLKKDRVIFEPPFDLPAQPFSGFSLVCFNQIEGIRPNRYGQKRVKAVFLGCNPWGRSKPYSFFFLLSMPLLLYFKLRLSGPLYEEEAPFRRSLRQRRSLLDLFIAITCYLFLAVVSFACLPVQFRKLPSDVFGAQGLLFISF